MTNRERESVAKLLHGVADRLAAAPTDTDARAVEYAKRAPEGRMAHQAGQLEQICTQEASAIRSMIASYLTPKTKAARGKR